MKLTEEELLERCRNIYCGEKRFKRNFIRLMKLYGIKHPFKHFMLPKHEESTEYGMRYYENRESFYGFYIRNMDYPDCIKTNHGSVLNDCDEEIAATLFYILCRRYG